MATNRNIHTVTLADGSTVTRTSENRTYTHVVVATYKSADDMKRIRGGWYADWTDGPRKDEQIKQNLAWCDEVGGTQTTVTWAGNETLGRKALASEQSRDAKRGAESLYAKLELMACTLTPKAVK